MAVATVLSCGSGTDRVPPGADGTFTPPAGREVSEPADEVTPEQRDWEAELQAAYQQGYYDGQSHAEAQPPDSRDCDYYYGGG